MGEFEVRSEEHTSELQSHSHLVCRLLLEKKNKKIEEEKDTSQNAQHIKNWRSPHHCIVIPPTCSPRTHAFLLHSPIFVFFFFLNDRAPPEFPPFPPPAPLPI